ncbi:MAG: hypothetical protein U0163_13970 [Gemmatimonadaceae bacterium]
MRAPRFDTDAYRHKDLDTPEGRKDLDLRDAFSDFRLTEVELADPKIVATRMCRGGVQRPSRLVELRKTTTPSRPGTRSVGTTA